MLCHASSLALTCCWFAFSFLSASFIHSLFSPLCYMIFLFLFCFCLYYLPGWSDPTQQKVSSHILWRLSLSQSFGLIVISVFGLCCFFILYCNRDSDCIDLCASFWFDSNWITCVRVTFLCFCFGSYFSHFHSFILFLIIKPVVFLQQIAISFVPPSPGLLAVHLVLSYSIHSIAMGAWVQFIAVVSVMIPVQSDAFVMVPLHCPPLDWLYCAFVCCLCVCVCPSSFAFVWSCCVLCVLLFSSKRDSCRFSFSFFYSQNLLLLCFFFVVVLSSHTYTHSMLSLTQKQ